MQSFRIRGGKKLKGIIDVRGSKNATTPILSATILARGKCVLKNVPKIEDVFSMIAILESMGAVVQWIGLRTLRIDTENIDPKRIDQSLVKKIRSSILLLGSLSARFDTFSLYHPGGCNLGVRPVGAHFSALEKMGVRISQNGKEYRVNAGRRRSISLSLSEFSVTATENVMMLAAGIPGKTVLKIAASEPHVEDLGKFLIAMGAHISGLGTHTLEIRGRKKLSGTEHTIIPDANEAATFLILGAATRSPISVRNARAEHLDLVLEKLAEFGVHFGIRKNIITVIPAKKLTAVEKVDTRIYPGIPTDVQAPFGVLATQAEGKTLIFDTMFESRFNYIGELNKMGAKTEQLNRREVLIEGSTELIGTEIESYDLRAGISLIIAGLMARGETMIRNIYQVDRGYEQIETRLKKLGADIERIGE
jgi:UDP-N-acetylglucosamine 1-carboxyvinyltransferase